MKGRWSAFLSALLIFLASAFLLKISFDAAANLNFAERDFSTADFISTCVTDLDTAPHPPRTVANNGHLPYAQ